MAPITAVAIVVAKPGREEELADLFAEMAEAAVADEGTDMYSVNRARKEPGRFFVYESYHDRDSLQAHASNPVLAKLGARLHELADSVNTIIGGWVAGDPPPRRA
jgi:quinol monooxygenase YgiN